MKIRDIEIDNRKIAFLLIFSAMGLLMYQLNFSEIIGAEGQQFTLFQFIGPIGAGILGPVGGALSVLAVEATNFIFTGKEFELLNLVRLLPMAFAAIYFGTKNKSSALVAAACMALFWMHPEGSAAWIYALYWIIPIGAAFYKKNLFVRSLGTTFTAHAVGSTVFLYALNLPAEVWMALIPIVAVERLLFASGISVSYYAVNSLLEAFSSKIDLGFLNIEKKYSLLKQ